MDGLCERLARRCGQLDKREAVNVGEVTNLARFAGVVAFGGIIVWGGRLVFGRGGRRSGGIVSGGLVVTAATGEDEPRSSDHGDGSEAKRTHKSPWDADQRAGDEQTD